MKLSMWAVAATLLVGGCTKNNPDFCCLTPEDCEAQGTSDNSRPCKDGLACVANECVAPTCATDSCASEAPVCEVTTGVCGACVGLTDCTRFSATPVCDSTGAGECVECLTNEDCTTAEPICDGHACRAAQTDDECPSGALGRDGVCVPEANAIYLSPDGTDTGTCTRSAPCQDLNYAFTQATNLRNHIVLKTGNYTTRGARTKALAQSFSVHGHGASLTGGNSDFSTLETNVPTFINDLSLRNSDTQGIAMGALASTTLTRVKLAGWMGLSTSALTTATDLETEATNLGIRVLGSIVLDRARIHGGVTGILADGGTLDITNTSITETTGPGMDLYTANGVMRFSTIARTGTGSGSTDAFGVHCGITNLQIQSSIIWNSSITARPPTDGSCTGQFTDTIAGPMTVGTAMNTNPMFANEVAANIHLSAGSPARDAVDAGPALDFEGDPRPRGVKFDIGADEAP